MQKINSCSFFTTRIIFHNVRMVIILRQLKKKTVFTTSSSVIWEQHWRRMCPSTIYSVKAIWYGGQFFFWKDGLLFIIIMLIDRSRFASLNIVYSVTVWLQFWCTLYYMKVSTREVDTAVTNALMELSGNELGKQDPRSSKPSFSCQVESGVPMGWCWLVITKVLPPCIRFDIHRFCYGFIDVCMSR